MPSTQQISNTPPEDKDEFQTPGWLFNWRFERFRFEVDLAATHQNAKCSLYYTKDEDALARPWREQVGETALWCNPPYSDIEPWLQKAAQERINGLVIDLLLPAMNGEVYWGKYVHGVASEVTFLNGRVSFIRPDGTEAKGNRQGSVLVTYLGRDVGPTRYVSVDTAAIRRAYK